MWLGLVVDLHQMPDGVRLTVKVVAGASRDRIVGELGGALKVTLAAPAERGRANKALLGLLAEALQVRPSQIRVESGASSPRKVVHIDGATVQQVLGGLRKARRGQ